MRTKTWILLLLVISLVPLAAVTMPAQARPAEEYNGPYFGENNFPPGCIRDMSLNNPDNDCYHMRTGLNILDSPQIDVLVMVPVSPTAERDMRIMRQSVEMWEAGIDYLATEMGLLWLAQGVDFHITVDFFDVTGQEEGGEFTTYPIVDPEIVVLATNPVGGLGIGIDPQGNFGDIFLEGGEQGLCHGIPNIATEFPFWEHLPGFDSHHDTREGIYTEDCGGEGGNICFAVNGAIDPEPKTIDYFGLFDLVSHEFGHCLTLGHVGDGAEGDWGALPSNDIMAYSADPPGLNKCVSTLDVEGFALRMSRYLDVDGDGAVTEDDRLYANDQIGEGDNAFQVQHPGDHLYASSTGRVEQCPQPDLGLVPGPRTQWTPTPEDSIDSVLTVTSPVDGESSESGEIRITGLVENRDRFAPPPVDQPTGAVDDADDDASSAVTEILGADFELTDTHLVATMALDQLWYSTDVASPVSYSLLVNGRKFDSFVRYAVDSNPMTWDNGASAYLPAGSSTWDLDANTVTFELDRSYLDDEAKLTLPYRLSTESNYGLLSTAVIDDSAPDGTGTVGVTEMSETALPQFSLRPHSNTVLTREGDFYPEDTSMGSPAILIETGNAVDHEFSFDAPVNVTVDLTWESLSGATDLDFYVTGAADSGNTGATGNPSETASLEAVQGFVNIRVDPYLIADESVTYTLTVTVEGGTGGGGIVLPDEDADGVPDRDDACPTLAGDGNNGCPIEVTEHIHVYLDGVLVGSQAIDTAYGDDAFDLRIVLDAGTYDLDIVWDDRGETIASESVTVTSTKGE